MSLSLVQEPPSYSALAVQTIRTRSAEFRDALAIYELIESLTPDGTLLPRTYLEICEHIGTFVIAEDAEHRFAGCASLHVYGPHLAEIRSTAVWTAMRGVGAGALLVEALLGQAQLLHIPALCLFTRIPRFFAQFGFRVVDRETIPDKINRDCRRCNRNSCCDETAMLLGYLSPSSNFVQIRESHI
jgi:amino-acid N-acetyltransferase